MMATAEECRQALGSLIARISEMNPEDRAAHLADRTLSCRVSDLGITFLTRLGPHGADSVREATAADEAAQIRFTAKSDDVLAIASDPGSFARAWLTGRLRVEGNLFDLLRLRKLMS
ncbi:MAG TPA: SCP2 sterol-binding domain-containing protein [Streptosporangiaceae bacterium]|nr:SCP2 sterol-binding domain-containing protein [Streptosporangiaceae bacterium]